MDQIIKNPGLDHIALKIFGFLNGKSLSKCLQVSYFWRHFIQSNRLLWLKRLTNLRQNHFIYYHGPSKLDKHPKILKQILFHYENHENPAKVQMLIEDLIQSSQDFTIKVTRLLHDNKMIWDSNPLSIVYPTTKKGNWTTILHLAFVEANIEKVKYLLEKLKENRINTNPRDHMGKTPLTNLLLWIRFVIAKKRQKEHNYEELKRLLYFICENFEYYRIDFNFKWTFSRRWPAMSIFEYLCYEQELECVEIVLKMDINRRIKNRDQVQILDRYGWKSISFVFDTV